MYYEKEQLILPNKIDFVDQHNIIDKEEFPFWTFDKMSETYRITEEIINQLTPEAIKEIFGATSDFDAVFDMLLKETYNVLYPNERKSIESSNFGYLDKLTESVEETYRCENLSYFITSVMPDFEMAPHHFDWCDIAQKFDKTCVMAARDHGKSYFWSNAYANWEMYRFKPKDNTAREQKNKRGFLFSFSIQQAIDLLAILREGIQDNDILNERLYDKTNWSKTDITCKNRARLTVKGFGSAVRGAHPGWIIVDDGLKDNVIYSADQRRKSIDYFHAVIMNMVVPGGKVRVVGTPFHNQDLYGDLKTKANWRVFEYPAIYPDGRILWANRWSYNDLMDKRSSQGNLIFSRELLCRPITSDSTIFPMEILNTAFFRMENYVLVNNRDSFPIKFNKVVTGCDFAISSSVGADYSVFLTWGIDDNETMWLLNVYRAKGASFAEQIAALKNINANFKPNVMMLEQNQMQQIFVQESERQGLPVMGHTTTGTRKNDMRNGLPSLAIMFERGKFKIPIGDQKSKDFADLLTMEFTSIAYTDKGLQSTDGHDDISMGSWISVEAARKATLGSFNFSWV